MDKPSLPTFITGEHHTDTTKSPHSSSILLRFVAWFFVTVWRTGVDWRTKRPLLTRTTAHLSIIALALVAILFSGMGIPAPQAAVGGALNKELGLSTKTGISETETTPTPTPFVITRRTHPSDADTITRKTIPHTTFPERPRSQVITYTVQTGDNIFNIATQFGLAPETIVWSNREAIKDAPWLLQPGLTLYILPVDGIYHTVRAGETVGGITEEYDVSPEVVYNEWNDLEEDDQLREGQLLVIPGGESEEVAWKPPEPEYSTTGTAQYSYGVCSGTSFSGPGANGWFILPTGSSRVSGWYFHDPRNPTHIGLDYGCNLGDPIYAAENGVVTISGWNGGYGNMVELSHGNGFTTRYGHFSQLAAGCGQPVYQGDLLGYCGSTGWSTGPHLHFEIRYNGVPQNPQSYLP